MATPAENVSQMSASVARTVIQGRIQQVRKVGQVFLHLIAMPAADPYSSPSVVEVSSGNRLGGKDEEVKVVCKVGGYRRQYETTDKETGERVKVTTADVRLVAVV